MDVVVKWPWCSSVHKLYTRFQVKTTQISYVHIEPKTRTKP
jgi:hypothetical protein